MTANERLSESSWNQDELVDLHAHTTASDGVLSPTELVGLAAAKNVKVLAITDHDSTEGLDEALQAARSYPNLRVVPGIEIGTDVPNGEVHVLGYFLDYHDKAFQRKLGQFRESRLGRAKRIIAKLAGMGIKIEWSRVQEIAGGGSVGRPHIAQAMFEKGYIPSLQEAFIKYIGRTGPAYAERYKLTPAEATQLITSVGGLPVVAHPADIEHLEALVRQLRQVGLVGIEVYYDGYPPEVVKELAALAKKHHLVPCGGSDFHGRSPDTESALGSAGVPMESARRLFALAQPKSAQGKQ